MLNPNLDLDALAQDYKAHNRIQIRDVLQAASAEDLYNVLARETPWKLVYYDQGRTVVLSPEEMQRLAPTDRAQRIATVYQRARDNFGFIYQAFLMAENYARKNYPGHPLHAVFEFLNSAPFVEMVRKISGIDSITGADGQATLYVPGHSSTPMTTGFRATNVASPMCSTCRRTGTPIGADCCNSMGRTNPWRR